MSVRMVHSSYGAKRVRIPGLTACRAAYACTGRNDADRQGSVQKQMANQVGQSARKCTTGEGKPAWAWKKNKLRPRDPGILTAPQMTPQLWIQAQFKNISICYSNKLRWLQVPSQVFPPLLLKNAAKAPLSIPYSSWATQSAKSAHEFITAMPGAPHLPGHGTHEAKGKLDWEGLDRTTRRG